MLPSVIVGKADRQVVVNWMYPDQELSLFLLDTLTNGPFPESHLGIRVDGPLLIFRSSQMEN